MPREDKEIADAVREMMEADGMHVILDTEITNVKCDKYGPLDRKLTVFYESKQGRDVAVSGSHLLLATGRTPNTDNLNLEAAGVQTDSSGHIWVDSALKTSASHIYALGDVHGGEY